MRTLFAFLLLAGSAAPALAAGEPGDTIRAHSNREARQQTRDEARAERSNDSDRPRSNRHSDGDRDNGGDRPQPVVQVERPAAHVESSANHQNVEPRARSFGGFRQGRADGGEQPAIQPSGHRSEAASDTVRNWRERERRSSGPRIVTPDLVPSEGRAAPALREQRRALPAVFRDRVPIVSSTPREGSQPPLRVQRRSSRDHHNWRTSWRTDHRYDWRNHRHRHRSLFHLGFYYDPFGWNYRPYQIGWRLWPSYYSSRFWLNDPWQYRLPYAPPGYRWIRYWDDAVLVDTFSGEVVDVIRNFFW